jgi:hypothetical protein
VEMARPADADCDESQIGCEDQKISMSTFWSKCCTSITSSRQSRKM